MIKRKGKMEELMQRRGSKRVEILFEVMLRYLKILDLDTGTIHSKIFKSLYYDKRKPYMTIADENYLSIDTLFRYVHRYDALAEKLIESNEIFKID
jgi:hypothetical protein